MLLQIAHIILPLPPPPYPLPPIPVPNKPYGFYGHKSTMFTYLLHIILV